MQDIKDHFDVADKDMLPILQEADIILQQKMKIDTKLVLLNAFNQHFNLSDDDLACLMSSTILVDDEFFRRLGKLEKVHADCQVLLGSEDQQLGIDLMDQSARTLNGAYDKLSRWIQKEFKTLDLENPRIHAPIRRALRILARQPSLFQECLNFFAEARERNLSDAFYAALTGSSSQTDDKSTKPMEYYAHDSHRFVGSILAWLHSAAVSERESLEFLFIAEDGEIARGLKAGMENEPWAQEEDQVFDGTKSLELLINRDLAGVSRAIRQRVEQVIKSDDDPVLAYKIAHLISFYEITLARLLGAQSPVLQNLSNLQESALQQYRMSTKEYANSIPTDSSHVPADLAPPDFLTDALSRLQEILKAYDASYATSERQEDDLASIFEEALEPFIRSCIQMSMNLKEPASSVFAINCLTVIRKALSMQNFPPNKVSEIEDSIDDHSAKLIDYQHAFFRQTSGVQVILVAIAPLTNSEEDLLALYKLDAFQKQLLTDSAQILNDFLPSALIDAEENIKRLQDLAMANEITTEAASRFCEDYDQVEERLTAADLLLEQHDDIQDQTGEQPMPLRSIFQRTSGEVRVLLS